MVNIFISWSGATGKRIARKLREVVGAFVHVDNIFMAEIDINKGAPWREELKKYLKESNFGFFILTPDQISSEWMAFEAGAVGVNDGAIHMLPLIFGVAENTIPKYLSEYQFANFTKEDYKILFKELNEKNDPEYRIDSSVLSTRFEWLWNSFYPEISEIISEASEEASKLAKGLQQTHPVSGDLQELVKAISSIQELSGFLTKIPNIESSLIELSKKSDEFQSRLSQPLRESGILSTSPVSTPNTSNKSFARHHSKHRLQVIIEQIERDGLLDDTTFEELKSAATDVLH